CNVYKSGNIGRYRRNLVRKIGEERVLALENDNRTHRWTVEELEQIRKQARADLRALKKGQMSKVA
ncbi:TPA: recombination protein NinG, partial [Yersinia enterocolitica]|nr:recombination protein NinG [Yersinia enterocolitica]